MEVGRERERRREGGTDRGRVRWGEGTRYREEKVGRL